MPSLFDPLRIGALQLSSRIVMAPLTRNRAPGCVPVPLMAQYYAQRADPATGAGLIVSEATQVCAEGQGYADTPGIHTPAQVAAWREVTDAVHARGGLILCQLWHVGRISHTRLQPGGQAPVSSTARAAAGRVLVDGAFVACSPPRALRTEEMPQVVDAFAHGARCAMEAGFDGVEVHAANGYLIEQFLRDTINDRSDGYGGDIEGRTRLLLEVMQAVAAQAGAARTGLRISPVTPANDAGPDSDPQALYGRALQRLAPLDLAFVHLIEGATGGPRDIAPFDYAALRRGFGGAWIVNNGYTREMALQAVAEGAADAVAFGKPFIANPDLGRRLREDLPLAESHRKTYYGGGAEGYTDYPAHAA
ncbi:MAG: alkene reductase [Rubrivivax sp.]|nr:alkene reductase [Rubrivivax sp.]